ncbi:MAG: hypothetical protein ACE5H1_09560, partial [Thermodesulfobacteriota bacterium]
MKYTNVGETSVFLEDFSYLRGILSAKILRSAKEIILFENAFPERTINVNKVKEFVKIVGGHALVRKFPKAQNNSLNWQINKLSLNINNNLEPKYKKSCGYRAVSKILQTDKLGLIFKHRMMDFLSRRGLY